MLPGSPLEQTKQLAKQGQLEAGAKMHGIAQVRGLHLHIAMPPSGLNHSTSQMALADGVQHGYGLDVESRQAFLIHQP
jgi:hypothetical protein